MNQTWDKIDQKIKTLPTFTIGFFSSCIKEHLSPKTIFAYAYEIECYITYLATQNNYPAISEITLFDIENITTAEFETYIFRKSENGNPRAMSALRKFYNYYYKNDKIVTNPAIKAKTPPKHHKTKKEKTPNLLYVKNNLLYGDGLSEKQMAFRERTMYRDISIMSLLLDCMLSPAQIAALDIDYINWVTKSYYHNGIRFQFDDTLKTNLEAYVAIERQPLVDYEPALFIGSRSSRNRLSTRSIEKIIKKYTGTNSVTLKHLVKEEFLEVLP